MGDRTLSIVVPAFNEERRIGALLDRVAEAGDAVAAGTGLSLHELIVVDDGSTDGTAAALASFRGLGARLHVHTLPRNRGKGAAVRAGMLAASGDLALLTDVDLSTPLEDLGRLTAALREGADIAIGSRALQGSDVLVHQPAHRELLGKSFNRALRLLTGLPLRDTQCGFKLFRTGPARRLFARGRVDGFAFDAEICVLARRLGMPLVEVPVRWSNDPRSHVRIVRSSARMALDLARIAWWDRRGRGTIRPAA